MPLRRRRSTSRNRQVPTKKKGVFSQVFGFETFHPV